MRIRSVIALSAVALTGVLLAGCSGSSPGPSASPSGTVAADLCASAAKSGTASDAVKTTGDVGAEPTVTFTSPVEVTAIERSVTTEGNGDKIANGDLVQYGIVAYDAETGEKLGSAGYEAGSALPIQISAESTGQFFGCATIGSRIVLALPGSEDAHAQINVVDVIGVTPTAAWGKQQEAPAGFPTVTLADDGTPSVALPSGDMPTAFEKATLKKGDGETVAAGDTVLVQYYGYSWNNDKEFDKSWGSQPFSFTVGQGVVDGFSKAVEGETVGSQVIAVLPPSSAYGEGEINDKDLTGQTLVFVVDILAVQHAAAQ